MFVRRDDIPMCGQIQRTIERLIQKLHNQFIDEIPESWAPLGLPNSKTEPTFPLSMLAQTSDFARLLLMSNNDDHLTECLFNACVNYDPSFDANRTKVDWNLIANFILTKYFSCKARISTSFVDQFQFAEIQTK